MNKHRQELEHFRKSGNRFSDKKCGTNKGLEPGFDSIKTGIALNRFNGDEQTMNELINFLGQWTWWIVAAVMFLLELMVMAFFFLWLGVAAVFTAIIDMFVDLSWQSELAIFAVFSVILLAASRYWAAKHPPSSDSPMLNKRGEALIGREFTLEEPMKHGRGWVRVADSIWQTQGPDLDAGTKIRVTQVKSALLIVERAEQNA